MNLEFNLNLEKPTLGGILTLLTEATILLQKLEVKKMKLYVYGKYLDLKWLDNINMNILKNYNYPVTTIIREPDQYSYPSERFQDKNFSYYSTARLSELYQEFKIRPSLYWSTKMQKQVAEKLSNINDKIIAIHMKNMVSSDSFSSNADPLVWSSAINEVSRNSESTFIIVGDDPPPMELKFGENLLYAKSLELNLSEQLSLIARSSGFIGTASGICSGAIFSDVPYVIFKSPSHHYEQMQEELGDADSLSFSVPGQKILRTIPNVEQLIHYLERF